MSGTMHGKGIFHQNVPYWDSRINIDAISQDDNSSQLSEDLGRLSVRSPDIGQRLRDLFRNQQFSDVKFVISHGGVRPKPSLEAHRAILACGSRKFADMLYGEGSREIVGHVHPEIQINNIPFEAFKNVVEYLYTDDIYFFNDSVVIETLSAARTFQVKALVEKCESYFELVEITVDNACSKYQLATTNKMESLKDRCAIFMQENTRAVIRSKDFKSSFLSTVRNIFKLPKFNLRSEKELFDAALDWVDAQTSDSSSSRRELIEPLLKHIRFLTFPLMEFTDSVSKCPDIFDTKDAMSIVLYLTSSDRNTSMTNLPTWCNKEKGNRCALVNNQSRGVPRNPIADQKVSISLRPFRRGYLNNLICVLEMKCMRGNYQVKGLKLAFGDPVIEHSSIGHLAIAVNVKPSEFHFVEHIKIDNSKEVIVPFSKNLLVRGGDTLSLRAEASEVKSYNFLQFDQENSFSGDIPFECSLGSVPKDNRLYFISEVMYVSTQPKPKHFRNFKNGRRS